MIARLKNDFFQGTSSLPFGNIVLRRFGSVLDGDLWICNNTVGGIYEDVISSFCCILWKMKIFMIVIFRFVINILQEYYLFIIRCNNFIIFLN